MMVGFYILASLVIVQGVIALLEGIRYLQYVRSSLAGPPSDYMPKAAILVPCKGPDTDFRENVLSLLGQDYPDYEVIFVVESGTDQAYRQLWGILEEQSFPHATLIEAGLTRSRSQKIHNLLAALGQVSNDVEVFAFADSDATTSSFWLRSLVAPLADPTVGAATGYRWYVPARGNESSLWRSLWNASSVTALGPHQRNFTWGGSTAIRRKTFDATGVRERWTNACSDDYVLSNAVKEHKLYVRFVPSCLLPSRGACDLKELLQFTTRQMIITRVYSPGLWWLALVSNFLFFGAFYGGIGVLLWRWWSGLDVVAVSLAVGLIYVLGVLKSVFRQKAVELVLKEDYAELKRYRLAYWLLYPLANVVFLYNLMVSAASRVIEWRGVRYKLVSPTETLILR
jgi:cellulose synthase/poly-beta-1,6-N-acetylglucosamine synthase-like glycosyltransferase